jgi:RHS repeat-associated protein
MLPLDSRTSLIIAFASTWVACTDPTPATRSRWTTEIIRYTHHGVAAGPVLITGVDASIVEERRHAPFGPALDAHREVAGAGSLGEVDYTVLDLGVLNQRVEPSSTWSYHGARWMGTPSGRWLSADPAVRAPDAAHLGAPWALHPYQYVLQNPVAFWDPDGGEERDIETGQCTVDVRGHYQAASFAAIGVDEAGASSLAAQDLNRRITGAYARMYLSDPSTMKWAGIAAYASHLVGGAMKEASGWSSAEWTGVPWLYSAASDAPTPTGMVGMLRQGNLGVFRDVYWQHLAFQQGGIALLELAAEQGSLGATALDGWRAIAAGRSQLTGAVSLDARARSAAEDLIWSGTSALGRHEQGDVLQPIAYAAQRPMWRWVSRNVTIEPPIGGARAFRDVVPDGDVGAFGDRMRWVEHTLSTWRRVEGTEATRVRAELERFDSESQSSAPP